jgi:phospholipid/cholesterol/gamma-HCH transport system ATP-binding protein
MASIIAIRDLKKTLAGQPVLRGISLNFEEGAVSPIIGQSGSGKSVLARHMIGIMSPDEGNVFFKGPSIGGVDESELVEIRRHFGYSFQAAALFEFGRTSPSRSGRS